jgi:Uma2 family endonuclease
MALSQPVGENADRIHGADPLTLADLEAMPDDGRRYELIGGAIVMTPAPVPAHQRILSNLFRLVQDACPPGHEVFFAPIDLDLPDEQRVEPDLLVVPSRSVGEKRLALPVLLVVEVVSKGSRTNDVVTKRAAYAEAGVPAYWLVDPERARITCLRLAGTDYEVYAEGPTIEVDWPVAVHLDVAALAAPPTSSP